MMRSFGRTGSLGDGRNPSPVRRRLEEYAVAGHPLPKGEGYISDLGTAVVQRKMWDTLRSGGGHKEFSPRYCSGCVAGARKICSSGSANPGSNSGSSNVCPAAALGISSFFDV